MEIVHSTQHRSGLRVMIHPSQVLLCALIYWFLADVAVRANAKNRRRDSSHLLPTTPDDRVVLDRGEAKPGGGENKLCSIQPFPGMPDTASVTSLQIPRNAQKEYEAACAALNVNKIPETERHLRKATEIYPQYVAGWVMLGQILETRQQTSAARNACSRASNADPKYLPAYLCLAEIAGREQQWNEVLSLTSRALELEPVNDAYAYFFSAIAYFNLNRLPEAQERALRAESIDRDHHEPLIQFLLAQIYDAKHDKVAAASHLREYKKLASNSQDTVRTK